MLGGGLLRRLPFGAMLHTHTHTQGHPAGQCGLLPGHRLRWMVGAFRLLPLAQGSSPNVYLTCDLLG